jgi:hypothetical protein
MVDKVEALVDAIARLNNSHDPESIAYRLRNPLLLRSFSKPGKHEVDETGRRVFGSYLNGYKAAVYDVKMKLSGSSHAGKVKKIRSRICSRSTASRNLAASIRL